MFSISIPNHPASFPLWLHSPLGPYRPLDSNSREARGIKGTNQEVTHIISARVPIARTQQLSHNHLLRSLGNTVHLCVPEEEEAILNHMSIGGERNSNPR